MGKKIAESKTKNITPTLAWIFQWSILATLIHTLVKSAQNSIFISFLKNLQTVVKLSYKTSTIKRIFGSHNPNATRPASAFSISGHFANHIAQQANSVADNTSRKFSILISQSLLYKIISEIKKEFASNAWLIIIVLISFSLIGYLIAAIISGFPLWQILKTILPLIVAGSFVLIMKDRWKEWIRGSIITKLSRL
ncbi:MAG: hypothetical protein Q7J78_00070 [Clostridiales bacterium]|nr:hypothetical protein [Clostridiales bacterium]